MTDNDKDTKAEIREGIIAQAASFVSIAEDHGYQNFERETEYFDGVMRDLDGEEEGDGGRSQSVSRDVADVIGWVMPQLMRIFMGADNVVDFEPEEEEHENAVDDATVYINTLFRGPLNGYRLLWDSIHDACLHRTGILKAEWDGTEEFEDRNIVDMDDVQWTELISDPDVEVLTHSERKILPENDLAGALGLLPPGVMPNADVPPQIAAMAAPLLNSVALQPEPMLVHTGRIRRVKSKGRLASSVIARDQFLIEDGAISLEDGDVGEKRLLRRSDLVEMGFDKDTVWDIPAGTDGTHVGRRHDETHDQASSHGAKETDEIDYWELYLRRDIDGDGVAERIKACFAGVIGESGLLSWEEWEEDELPYSELTIEPVPHRFDGRSLYDATADIQKIKTVVGRNLLDTSYDGVDPLLLIDIDALDPDYADESLSALQNPSAERRLVYGKQGAASPLVDKMPDMQAMVAILGMQDQVIEKRTGISRATMALNPETLQNQTATAAQLQSSAQYSKVELIARNLAELGLQRYFGKLYKLVSKHEKAVKRVRVGKNNWREIRPESWPERMAVVVNVGLGTGNRDRDVQGLMAIRQTQMGYMQLLGPNNPWVDINKVRRTDEKLIQAMGIRSADAFIADPTEDEIKAYEAQRAQAAQQGDPAAMAKAQAEQQKFGMEMARDKAKFEADVQERLARLQMEAQAQQAKLELERQGMENDLMLKREQLAAEIALKRELQMQELQMRFDAGLFSLPTGAATSGVHLGGDIG